MYTHHFTHDRLSRWVYRLCRWVCQHVGRSTGQDPAVVMLS
jgi:hypothetical protein